MNLKNKLIKSFFAVGLIKIISIPIGLVTSIILARTLGPEGFGQYSFIMALIPLIALPVNGGLLQLLTREVSIFVHERNWGFYRGALKAAHLWVILTSTVILIIFWVTSISGSWLSNQGKWSLLPIALFMVPLLGLSAIRVGCIKGLGLPAYAEIPGQLIQPSLMVLLFGILAWKGLLNSESAIFVQVVGATFVFLLASWMFFRIQPNEAKQHGPKYILRRWGSSLFPFSMISFVNLFNAQIGVLALGLLGNDEQVAAMRIAERGGQFVILSLTVVNMIIAPYIVRAYRDGDKVLLQRLATKSARGSFIFAILIAGLFVFGGERLIRFAFGPDYGPVVYWPLVIVCIGQVLNVYFGSVGNLLSMSGFEKHVLKGQVIAMFVNISLCFMLIPMFGEVGAAISVSVGIVSWNFFMYLMVRRLVGVKSCAF